MQPDYLEEDNYPGSIFNQKKKQDTDTKDGPDIRLFYIRYSVD